MENEKKLTIIKYNARLNFAGKIKVVTNDKGTCFLYVGEKLLSTKKILELFEDELLKYERQNAPKTFERISGTKKRFA